MSTERLAEKHESDWCACQTIWIQGDRRCIARDRCQIFR
jgi:hypothetical protein